MKIEILLVICVFLLGFLSASLASSLVNYYDAEVPLLSDLGIFNDSNEKAPADFVKDDQILVFEDRVVILVEDATLSKYSPTGSMRPVLDFGSNGIRVKIESSDDISIGDIVSFRKNNMLIVHRVIEKGEDLQGTYFITKGDNNSLNDGKVRFSEIKYLTIGILY